jgi:putative oligomerization/nucleic acid binding protein
VSTELGSVQLPAGGEEKAPAEAPPAPAPAGGDYTQELEKLAKLRDEGVITAEDFEAKKKQLLGI